MQRLLNSSRPSRGDPFPPVLAMEAAENHPSHNLAVLGKGMFVVILQRWEYRGTLRNPQSEAQMRAPLVVMSNQSLPKMLSGANAFEISDIERMNIGAHQPGV